MQMVVIDADGEWWINTAAYPMVDSFRLVNPNGEDVPENHTNFRFESGVKYRIRPTAWMATQPTLVKTDDVDQEILEQVQVPNVTRDDTADTKVGAAAKPKATKK